MMTGSTEWSRPPGQAFCANARSTRDPIITRDVTRRRLPELKIIVMFTGRLITATFLATCIISNRSCIDVLAIKPSTNPRTSPLLLSKL